MEHQEGASSNVESAGARPSPAGGLVDLGAPAELDAQLRDLVASIRAHERGGFVALFTGASGTGKTMAAEAVAGELEAAFFRVDVGRVVSKYIGETEKNLAEVFEQAEEARAVLLFDEADALFGKRSEVRDAGDRYANMKVDYLLQRIEEYPGVAILTANLRPDFDEPFARHLDRIIEFTAFNPRTRPSLWRRIFPWVRRSGL